jgi:hypothetical protein
MLLHPPILPTHMYTVLIYPVYSHSPSYSANTILFYPLHLPTHYSMLPGPTRYPSRIRPDPVIRNSFHTCTTHSFVPSFLHAISNSSLKKNTHPSLAFLRRILPVVRFTHSYSSGAHSPTSPPSGRTYRELPCRGNDDIGSRLLSLTGKYPRQLPSLVSVLCRFLFVYRIIISSFCYLI